MENTIQNRLEEMRTVKNDFLRRYEENNLRTFAFLLDDGSFHLPNAWRICETITDEVTNEFDGSVTFIPRIDSRIQKEGFQYEYLTRIYNQVNKSIGIQANRKMAIKDAVRYGFGVMFEGYVRVGEVDSFNYLVSERVDPRDFFIDPSALMFYDPQGLTGARDCIRRRWYNLTTFEKTFKGNPMFDQAAIQRILDGYKTYQEAANKINASEAEKKNGIFQSSSGTVKDQEDAMSVLDENEIKTGVIMVLEYWSREVSENEPGVQQLWCRGEKIFDEENTYDELPFTVYSPFLEQETLFPPSLIEVMSPMLKLKELLANLWYMNARLSSTPIIYASDETGLVAGQPLRPGVQTVQLEQGMDIRTKIQEIKLGGVSDTLMGFMSFLDDELTKASSLDQRALQAKPEELATQTLQKVENELKSLRGMINTMMISSETHRAFLRAKNIIKFVFSNKRDVLVSDYTMQKDGKMKSAKGSLATITIDESDWEGMEFDVNVISKKEGAFLEGQKRDDLLRLMEIAGNLLQQSPEIQERFRMDALFEEILKTFTEIDTTKIFIQDKGVSQIQSELEMAKRGENIKPQVADQKGKEGQLKAAMKAAQSTKDPVEQQRLLSYIIQLNDAKPMEFSEELPVQQGSPMAAQPAQAPASVPAA